MLSIGVDRCKSGWFYFVISKDNGEYFFGLKKEVFDILNLADDDDIILVDMPIGLSGKGKKGRRCDFEARKILGPRRASVFQVPSRPILRSVSGDFLEEAPCHITKKLGKVSWRGWMCLKKIWPISEEAILKAFHKKSGAGMDDILDGMLTAVTGLQNPENIYTLPDRPERDNRGIPMQIIYASITSPLLHSP